LSAGSLSAAKKGETTPMINYHIHESETVLDSWKSSPTVDRAYSTEPVCHYDGLDAWQALGKMMQLRDEREKNPPDSGSTLALFEVQQDDPSLH
jgi:hypothetical protein